MGRNSQAISRSELRRRQEQSRLDRELQRRREQSARDRANNQRQLLARPLDRLPRENEHALRPIQKPVTMASSWLTKQTPANDPNPGRAFGSLFNDKKYSDVKIFLGESNFLFPAHRLVLGICSPYFDDALQSGFKEGITHEFKFEEESPHALWRVLQYMYTGDYSDEPSEALESDGDDLELLRHPRVYALADMFRIEDLKILSRNKFKQQVKKHWISDTFVDCIREVYSTSMKTETADMRQIIVKIVSLHREELVYKRPLQELLREGGEFAVGLVLEMAGVENPSW